jgi:hypothetical protein
VMSLMEGDCPGVVQLMHPAFQSLVAESCTRRVQQQTQQQAQPQAQPQPALSPETASISAGNSTGPTSAKSAPLFGFVRINLVNFEFSRDGLQSVPPSPADISAVPAASSASSVPPTSAFASVSMKGAYWVTKHVKVILPATSYDAMYLLLDQYDVSLNARMAKRTPPTPEKAQEIIMRTLFSKLGKAKKNN